MLIALIWRDRPMSARPIVTALLFTLLTVPAFAQDATPEATADPNVLVAAPITSETTVEGENEFVAGAGTPILLIGLGAVLAVGGITLLRDNAKK
jgi:hypothetical protein